MRKEFVKERECEGPGKESWFANIGKKNRFSFFLNFRSKSQLRKYFFDWRKI